MFLPNLRGLLSVIIKAANAASSIELWGWGRNQSYGTGALGLGDRASRNNESRVGNLTDWDKIPRGFISNGSEFSLFIKSNNTLWAVGNNSYGKLGRSNTTNVSSPVQVGSLSNWSYVSTGSANCVAVKTDGTLWSWGNNTYGQLGQGNTTVRSSPVQIGTDTNWYRVLCGQHHVIALKTNGTLWAWGRNQVGQLGLGNVTVRSSPVQIGSSTNWTKIGIGQRSSAAINSSGELFVWGRNASGMLGLNNTTDRSSPVQVGSLTDWNFIEFGGVYSNANAAALKTNGTLWIWGSNVYGQLGQGNITTRSSPVQVGSSTEWTSAAVGNYFTLAINNGKIWFSGQNNYGALAGKLSRRGTSFSPFQIGSDTNWGTTEQTLTAGYSSFAIKNTGSLWAWSNNTSGQLGINSTTTVSKPTQVGALTTWSLISHRYNSERSVIAAKTDGTIWMWGSNASGQLGQGNVTVRSSPVQVGSDTSWSISENSFSNFGRNTMAIKSGALWVWGQNSNGILGTGNVTSFSSPVQLGTDTNWSKVAVGERHAMVIKSTGSLWAMGYNGGPGFLGIGLSSYGSARSSPVQVGTDLTWSKVSTGNNFTLALKSNGTLWSWGSNSYGRLGLGNTTHRSSPVQIGSATDWSKICASNGEAAAIKTNGTLWMWGANNYGQLATGDGISKSSPVQVGTDTDWSLVFVGNFHVLATKTNGTLWAWGTNGGYRTAAATNSNYIRLTSSPVQIGTTSTWKSITARVSHMVVATK
jgi:alpha-tubulin suppressor-like RCC1 family protein